MPAPEDLSPLHLRALLALTALAAAIRFATLDLQSFDFDEAYTVARVLDGSLGDALAALPQTESSPPLHYALAWLWTRQFGLGEVGIRSLSALAGTALVPVVWAAARELATQRAALVAAALVTVNPFLVWFSQEARAYSLLTLLAALSFWAFARALAQPSRRRLAVWALASSFALLSHYFAAFLVIPEALWLLASARPRVRVALATGAIGAVGVALLPLALAQADGRTDWISGQPFDVRVRGVVSKFLVGEVDPIGDGVLTLVAAAALALLIYGFRRAVAHERRGGLLALAVGAAAVALPLALDLAGLDYLIAKNAIAALPVLAVAAGAALGARRSGIVGAAGAGALCAFSLAIVVASTLDPRLQRPDYRAAAEAIGDTRPDMAVIAPFHGSVPLGLYLPGALEVGRRGAAVRDLELVEPIRRRDDDRPARPASPPPPAGFALLERHEADSFTRTRYRARRPRRVDRGTAQRLSPGTPNRRPVVLSWPAG